MAHHLSCLTRHLCFQLLRVRARLVLAPAIDSQRFGVALGLNMELVGFAVR